MAFGEEGLVFCSSYTLFFSSSFDYTDGLRDLRMVCGVCCFDLVVLCFCMRALRGADYHGKKD